MSEQAGTNPTIEELLTQLRSRDAEVREAAALELSKTQRDERATTALIAALNDEDSGVRAEAAYALQDQGDESAVEPLIAALKDDDSSVRSWAAVALKRLQDMRAFDPLIACLKDPDGDVRMWAASALARLGDNRAVDPLIALASDPEPQVRRGVMNSLEELHDNRAISYITYRLQHDPDETVRWYAAMALETFADTDTMDVLIDALRDPFFAVRLYSVEALVQIRDKRAVAPILDMLSAKERIDSDDKKEESARETVARALGEFGDMRVFEPLVGLLKDTSKAVRHGAAHSLALLGELAFSPLLALLKDSDPWVRIGAAMALGYMRDARALPALLEMQANDTGVTPTGATVKLTVSKAIKRITEKSEDD